MKLHTCIVKVAKQILPAGHRSQENWDTASWYKRSGHAGAGMIDRAVKKAEALGFKPGKFDCHGSPDGTYVGSSEVYSHPDGWELSFWRTYGAVAYDNSFGMELKKVVKNTIPA